MKIHLRKRGSVNLLHIFGKITIGRGDVILRDRLNALLAAGERLFILNLTEVPYLDSAGVGEMVACHKRVRERGGVIKLVLLAGGKPHEVFVMAALDRVFRIFSDEDAAIVSFASDGDAE